MRISDWSSDVCSSDLLGRYRLIKRRHGPRLEGPGRYLRHQRNGRKKHFAIQVQRKGRERNDKNNAPNPQASRALQIEVQLIASRPPTHPPAGHPTPPPIAPLHWRRAITSTTTAVRVPLLHASPRDTQAHTDKTNHKPNQ